MNSYIKYLLYFLVMLVLQSSSCRTVIEPEAKDVSRLEMTKGIEPLSPDYYIYHTSNSESELYFRVFSSDLIYNRSESDDYTAKIKVNYRVWTISNVKQVADSGTAWITDVNNSNELREIKGVMKMNLPFGSLYKARIQMTDQKKNVTTETELLIRKNVGSGSQFYKITDLQSADVLYSPFLFTGKKGITSITNKGKKIFGRYYNRDIPLARPPFSEGKIIQFDYDADSLFVLHLNDSGYLELNIPEKGFIHLQTDTTVRDGLTLFSFPKYFPRIGSPEALIAPLRYISSNDEFDALLQSEDKKAAVDEFWLKRSGSKERAREVIRQFYGRVEEGNRRYSSFTEGWRTDRGMIYLIFGEPTFKEFSNDSETWIYGDRFVASSMRLNFSKVSNPFTDNDYVLQRLPGYKPYWYNALDAWRSGKVYTFVQ